MAAKLTSEPRTIGDVVWTLEYRADDALFAVSVPPSRWFRTPKPVRLLITPDIIEDLGDAVDMSEYGLAASVLEPSNREALGVPGKFELRDNGDGTHGLAADGESLSRSEYVEFMTFCGAMVRLNLELLAHVLLTPDSLEALRMVDETPSLRDTYMEGAVAALLSERERWNRGVDERREVAAAEESFLAEATAASDQALADSEAAVTAAREERLRLLMPSPRR